MLGADGAASPAKRNPCVGAMAAFDNAQFRSAPVSLVSPKSASDTPKVGQSTLAVQWPQPTMVPPESCRAEAAPGERLPLHAQGQRLRPYLRPWPRAVSASAFCWTPRTGHAAWTFSTRSTRSSTLSGHERGTMGYPIADMKCGLKAKGWSSRTELSPIIRHRRTDSDGTDNMWFYMRLPTGDYRQAR